MAQDIRELFQNDKGIPRQGLPSGHEQRFEARLNTYFKESHRLEDKAKQGYFWTKIAAVLIIIIAIGGLLFKTDFIESNVENPGNVVHVESKKTDATQLSDLSPEFKKLEGYYKASINVALAEVDLTADNKALVDSYMTHLEELNEEYGRLNEELVAEGASERIINSLIDNLQTRLDLLTKLKKKLQVFKEGDAMKTNRL